VILLPPSETKAAGGTGGPWSPGTMTDRALDKHRRPILTAARSAGAAPRRSATRPAMERYQGVLFRELDWASLPAAARRRGDEQLRVVSGLWGLVAPPDPIPEYKLKMSARLAPHGVLASYWRPRLAPVVAELTEERVVWDLLPIEHSAAMTWATCAPRRRVTVRFVDARGATVSHWNKLLKGALVRWLLTASPVDPEELVGFEHPLGYVFDPSASDLGPDVAAVVLRQR
jgi:cytoplasmic iron level regulating protein YaaA (DUF328/UPF0246 family)